MVPQDCCSGNNLAREQLSLATTSLGPLLFCLHTYDAPTIIRPAAWRKDVRPPDLPCCEDLEVHQFTDDIHLVWTRPDRTAVRYYLQAGFSGTLRWASANEYCSSSPTTYCATDGTAAKDGLCLKPDWL